MSKSAKFQVAETCLCSKQMPKIKDEKTCVHVYKHDDDDGLVEIIYTIIGKARINDDDEVRLTMLQTIHTYTHTHTITITHTLAPPCTHN